MKHESWSSPVSFLIAAIGVSVGLGNVWRFPFLAGENGGGAFVLIYLGIVVVLGIPLLVAELSLGRRGGGSPMTSMQNLIAGENASKGWKAIGVLSMLIPILGLSYYAVVAGWTMDYILKAAEDTFTGISSSGAEATFDGLKASPVRTFFWHTAFIAITVWVVARGIRGGLEKVLNFMMPALFILLFVLVIYAAFAADIRGGLEFMFVPDWSKVTGQTILMALGQSLFSIAIGVGGMITYGAYLDKAANLPGSASIIVIADTFVALLAGLAIFPFVFQYGLNPSEGPGLIFVTLPIAFGQMPGGVVLAMMFFILMFFAAFSSSIAMLEPLVSWLEEQKNMKRAPMAIVAGLIAWSIGIGPTLSFNILKDFYPLDFIDYLGGKNLFGLLDFLIANLLIPLNALLIALFAGWVLSRTSFSDEIAMGSGFLLQFWRFIIRFVAPIAIGAIFLVNLG